MAHDLGPFPGVMLPYTKKAIDDFKNGSIGDIRSRDDMKHVIGLSVEVGDKGYTYVNTAIRFVEKNHGTVWRWDRSLQAWRCLGHGDRVTETTRGIGKARRAATRALIVASTVDVEELTAEQKTEHRTNMAIAGMTRVAASGAFRKRVDRLPEPSEPKTDQLLALMKSAT